MKRVLVIDDDEDIREFLVILFRRKGFDSVGLSALDTNKLSIIPDVILLDYLLGGESGLEICKNLREKRETRDTPVIMISALSDVKDKCISAGATEFMCKPFNVDEILSCVNKVLLQRA